MHKYSESLLFCEGGLPSEDEETYVGVIGSVGSEAELFKEVAAALKFPLYFGENWNALDECLRDFSWIKEKNIILCHEAPLALCREDMRLYLDVLHDSVKFWKTDPEHSFCVTFQFKDKEQILGD